MNNFDIIRLFLNLPEIDINQKLILSHFINRICIFKIHFILQKIFQLIQFKIKILNDIP